MSRVCLIVIDGLGVAPSGPGNARTLANMPTIQRLENEVPNVQIEASGNAVGLPKGQQGASEPGHLTMGAGRIVWQPFEEINRAIDSGEFFENRLLNKACEDAASRDVPLHLFILYSEGGVHGHINHMHSMMKLAEGKGVTKVCLHLFGDGRDVPEQSICEDIEKLQAEISSQGIGTLCSLIGRFYAMDRDQNWNRTQVAYDLLTQGKGEEVKDFCEAAKSYYSSAKKNEYTDYYLPAYKSSEFVPVEEDHVVINLNFRSDRERQITAALTDEKFDHFPRPVRVKNYICMGPYSDSLPIAYPPQKVPNNLGEVLSSRSVKQLRISETEKYAHVTYFFNSQRNDPYPGEDRINIPSPKVASYAEKPEMSAKELADELIKQVESEKYDFILINFANPDLVGHSGDIDAVVKACETVDEQLHRLIPVLEEHDYDWILTADHGNAEEMYYPGTETICPAHTTNPVQAFVKSSKIASTDQLADLKGLKDIAPLCLKLMGIEVPEEMR